MTHALADDIFVGFDVSEDDKPFLFDVLAAPGGPWDEKLAIYDLGLFSGYEDWNLLLECAASLKEKTPARSQLDARDILAFVPRVKEATLAGEKLRQGWAATDQSIKNLAALLRVHRSGTVVEPQPAAIKQERVVEREGVPKRAREDDEVEEAQPKRVKRQKTAPKPSRSHYFAQPADEQLPRRRTQEQLASTSAASTAQTGTSAIVRNGIATPNATPRKQSHESDAPKEHTTGKDPLQSIDAQNARLTANGANDDSSGALKANGPQIARDLRAETPSWPTPRSTPSPMNSSELLSPEDLSRVKFED